MIFNEEESAEQVAAVDIEQGQYCSSKSKNKVWTMRRVIFGALVALFGFSTLGNTAFFALLKIKFALQPAQLNTYTWITTLSLIWPAH